MVYLVKVQVLLLLDTLMAQSVTVLFDVLSKTFPTCVRE
ncbi:hypothetical protein faergetype_113 [Salmonella phage faergetype]|uniref:Uncharacterized protein n=2 Tax=Caudoviricetes TaxID=2731619 RepID=A0A6G9L7C1_9CAUD|nr:hypothetical protein HWD23_gp144 [Salmonella phage faergetype]QIQ61470.1 hypothetical protein faergetype_113 [Salmonella phage faergetype]